MKHTYWIPRCWHQILWNHKCVAVTWLRLFSTGPRRRLEMRKDVFRWTDRFPASSPSTSSQLRHLNPACVPAQQKTQVPLWLVRSADTHQEVRSETTAEWRWRSCWCFCCSAVVWPNAPSWPGVNWRNNWRRRWAAWEKARIYRPEVRAGCCRHLF